VKKVVEGDAAFLVFIPENTEKQHRTTPTMEYTE
jgi:hypothetical protein